MKMVMIAALAAAQLSAAAVPALAADLPRQEAVTPQPGSDGRSELPIADAVEPALDEGQATPLRMADSGSAQRAAAAHEDKPKKRKSTGDKVLTGAAIVLGIGALAVGGLLIAIFVQ